MGQDKSKKTINQLLAKIALSKGMLKLKQKTAPKFPIIKSILKAVFEKQPPGTKLPSIRQIAKTLETTSVPVQKVVSQLAEEGVIHVKPRSGIVAGPATEAPAQGNISSIEGVLRNVLALGADTQTCRIQKEYWDLAQQEFCRTNPFINVKTDYNYCHLDDPYYFDLMEVNGVTMCKELDGQGLMTLNDFFDEDDAKAAKHAVNALPIYYHTAYFFYNKSVMIRNKLPLPGYRNFFEQVDYIEKLKEHLKKTKGNYQLYSTLQPFVFLGDVLQSMIAEIKSRSMFYSISERKLYLNAIGGLVKLYKLLNDHDFTDIDVKQERLFINHKAVGFIGQSLNANSIKSQTLGFNWDVYPFFCVDNTCLKIPMLAVVLQNTKKPVEAIRFINGIFDESVQKVIGASGSVPLELEHFEFLKFKAKNLFASAFEAASKLIINSEEKLYLALNIINSELWNCILNNKEPEVALKHIRTYGTAYMKQLKKGAENDSQ